MKKDINMKCPGCGGQEKTLWRKLPPAQLQFHCTGCETRWDLVLWQLKGKWLYTGPAQSGKPAGRH